MRILSLIVLALCIVPAQAQTPLSNVTLPAYVMAGGSYNQFTGASGFVSAVVPESNSVGVYGSMTADLVPAKYTDPATKRTGYLISGSFRAGQHKVLFNGSNNMLLIGGDVGASFNSSGTPAAVNIGVAGSFTITYVRQFGAHWAAGIPVRMLYMSGVGPNGTGAWNPVVQFGLIWKP